jgi:hypothetical protein
MNFDLVRPCGDCPFRSDRLAYIRAERVREILGGGKGKKWWPASSFPCHKTIEYGEGDRAHIPQTAQQCAGVMIILHREGRHNDAMQLGERFGMWDPSRLDLTAPVHATTEAAIDAAERSLWSK